MWGPVDRAATAVRTAALMRHGSGWRAGGVYVTVASNRRLVDPGYRSGPERVDDIVEAA
jgi:hypothetical protein